MLDNLRLDVVEVAVNLQGFLACSSDEDKATVFNYDELPAWLISQAKGFAESHKDYDGDPTILYSISRATGIHGETVYHIYSVFDSCLMCNLYDEDGNPVSYTDVFGEKGEGDTIGDEGWVVIFPRR